MMGIGVLALIAGVALGLMLWIESKRENFVVSNPYRTFVVLTGALIGFGVGITAGTAIIEAVFS